MTAPTLRVELLARSTSRFFNFFIIGSSTIGGDDVIAAADDALLDITGDVIGMSYSRGRQRETDAFQAGRCTIKLENRDRRYDPTNTASDLYGNVEPGRVIKITAVVAGVDYPLFYGYTQNWAFDYSNRGRLLASVDIGDVLAILGRQELPTIAAAYAGDLSGARISRVLDRPEVNFPADLRSIDAGLTTLGATTFGQNVTQYLATVARSENGDLFATTDGLLRFRQRNTAPGSSACTFSDSGAAGNVLYTAIAQDFSDVLLFNRIDCAGSSGIHQIAEDTDSEAAYQVRSLLRSGMFASSDTEMLQQAELLLARYSTPELRFRSISVDVHSLSDARQADVLGLELCDRVSAVYTPPGAGTPSQITQDGFVDGFNLNVSVTDQGELWKATVTVRTGQRVTPFIIGDPVFGVIGQNFIGY